MATLNSNLPEPDPAFRYSGIDPDTQARVLREIVSADSDLKQLLMLLRDSGLSDAWLVSGAVYGTVWNTLSGKPARHGINDYDIIYFDGADLSWAAEDTQIRATEVALRSLELPLEIRNQARVHLWFPEKFGMEYPQLSCATQSLNFYASKTQAVAVRLNADDMEVSAPFGLEDIFAFRMTPNRVLANRVTHMEKALRAKGNWPELSIVEW